MILKYFCNIENGVQHYTDVELHFQKALSIYPFIQGVEYDGESINLIIDNTKETNIQQWEPSIYTTIFNTLGYMKKIS